MERKARVIVVAALAAWWVAASGAAWAQSTGSAATDGAGRGIAALDAAARGGKHLFIFFWKDDNEQAARMYGVFESGVKALSASADAVAVRITDPRETALVKRYDVDRAPMPLVLAIAPNGAVTRAFPAEFNAEQLRAALVSPCTARCMKALQDRKWVVLCVVNAQTQFAQEAWRGAAEFRADARFAQAAELVPLDPSDPNEAEFLQALRVDPATTQAVTLLLAPPGQVVARLTGAVSKDQLAASAAASRTGCCPGGTCGPKGCGPTK